MKIRVIILFTLFLFVSSCTKEEIVTTTKEQNFSYDILVDIKGEVMFPGVYSISQNALIKDAIMLAGGVTKDADLSKINLVQTLSSNQMLIIPKKQNSSSLTLININTATLSELMSVPKIGEAKANAIIDYRNKNGNFVMIEDLMKVSGISEGLYEQIKTYITIS